MDSPEEEADLTVSVIVVQQCCQDRFAEDLSDVGILRGVNRKWKQMKMH